MTPRLCTHCRQVTYPDKWCECDPWVQVQEFFSEICADSVAGEGVPPEETMDRAYTEALLR